MQNDGDRIVCSVKMFEISSVSDSRTGKRVYMSFCGIFKSVACAVIKKSTV